jgi:hypothetical protein
VDDSASVKACAARLVEELHEEPSVALRFARARQGNFSKAKPFLEADLVWRAQKTSVTQADCPTALATGAWRALGCTSAGVSVVLFHAGLSDLGKYDVDEYERYAIYFAEHLLKMGRGEKFVVIIDLHGWRLSQVAPLPLKATPSPPVLDHVPRA